MAIVDLIPHVVCTVVIQNPIMVFKELQTSIHTVEYCCTRSSLLKLIYCYFSIHAYIFLLYHTTYFSQKRFVSCNLPFKQYL